MAEIMTDKVKISIYLDPEVNRRLRIERAENPGSSVSEIVEAALRSRFADLDRRPTRKAR